MLCIAKSRHKFNGIDFVTTEDWMPLQTGEYFLPLTLNISHDMRNSSKISNFGLKCTFFSSNLLFDENRDGFNNIAIFSNFFSLSFCNWSEHFVCDLLKIKFVLKCFIIQMLDLKMIYFLKHLFGPYVSVSGHKHLAKLDPPGHCDFVVILLSDYPSGEHGK